MDEGLYTGLIGLSYRRNDGAALAAFGLAQPYTPAMSGEAPLQAMAREMGLHECIYLSTCNRVELWFVANTTLPITTVRHRFARWMQQHAQTATLLDARALHAYVDEGAFERMFVIAAALDSMVPGEAQVLGQLKAAVQGSDKLKLVGPHLRPLVQAAFAAAKDVREHTSLGRGKTSMMSLVEAHLEACLQKRAPAHTKIAVLGTGEMARSCVQRLIQRRNTTVLVISRAFARAHALCERIGAKPATLAQLQAQQGPCQKIDAIVSATTAEQPLVDAALIATLKALRHRPCVLIDLGVPPNIDAEAARCAELPTVDYAMLTRLAAQHQKERLMLVAEARQRIDTALERFMIRLQQRRVATAVRAWRGHCEQVLHHKLKELPSASDDAALGRWANELTQALAHAPTEGLKSIAQACGQPAVDAFVSGARLSGVPKVLPS